MTPYKDPTLVQQFSYFFIWIFSAITTILYSVINWKKYSVINWFMRVFIGSFIWWGMWLLVAITIWQYETLAAAIWGVLSMEIMWVIKERWPEIIKEKLKRFFNLK